MATIRIACPRGLLLSGFLAAVWLSACLPAPEPIFPLPGGTSGTATGGTGPGAGGGPGSGTAGTAAGGTGNPGSGGGAVAGTGAGMTAGTSGGAPTGTAGTSSGGTMGAAGRGGSSGAVGGRGGTSSSTGGRGGRGGGAGTSSTPDAGVSPDASNGGSSGTAPVTYALCVQCHGDDGKGVAGKGPDIQHPVNDYFTWVIRNGRMHPNFPEAMPAFTTAMVSDAQLQAILTFLAAFPKPTTGMGLFVDYCANCHGADGAGGVTMRPIASEPMTMFTTLVRNGHSAGMFSNRREYMPKWTTTEITNAELQLIFTYVSGL
jgi:mono/diheme cytochrome c family protein